MYVGEHRGTSGFQINRQSKIRSRPGAPGYNRKSKSPTDVIPTDVSRRSETKTEAQRRRKRSQLSFRAKPRNPLKQHRRRRFQSNIKPVLSGAEWIYNLKSKSPISTRNKSCISGPQGYNYPPTLDFSNLGGKAFDYLSQKKREKSRR